MGIDIPRRTDTRPLPITDMRASRAGALGAALRAHRYEPEVAGNEVRLPVPGDAAPPLVLACEHRASDEGRLWFITGNGEPLAPADAQHLHEAITAVKARVAPTRAVGM